MSAAAPLRIGRYLIESELGRGMMGVVYRARDPELDRPVALKTIQLAFAVPEGEREAFEKRFLAEARAAAKLAHPAIVVVHDVGRDALSGALYIALELLQGRTLEDLVRTSGPLPWPDAVRIGMRLAEALGHAHEGGVIHRDVKPANVMVTASGEPKLMDFGVAKLDSGNLTASGETFGTPLFMSPEQALGEPLDGRADLFALGSVVYFALTGRNPFAADSVPAILAKVAYETPAPPSALVPEIPVALDAVLARAMAKARTQRHRDGGELAEALGRVVRLESGRATATDGRPLAIGTVAGGRLRAPVALVAVAVVGALVAVLGGIFWWGRGGQSPSPPRVVAPATTPEPEAVVPTASPAAEPALQWSLASPRPAPTAPRPAPTASPVPASARVRAAAAAGPSTARPLRGAPAGRSTATPAQAHLFVDFEHGLKHGRLRLLSGESLLLEVPLRKPDQGRGSVQRMVDLAPGEHHLRVSLILDSETEKPKIEELSAVFVAGATRQLEIRHGGLFKRLTLKLK